MHSRYSHRGLEILAFQCTQFFNQAPGTDQEFLNSLKYVRPGGGYEPPFKIFSTIEVNGANTHPIYQHLKAACPVTPGGFVQAAGFPSISWTPVAVSDISWNFGQFLVDRNGMAVQRFDPASMQDVLDPVIEKLLGDGEVSELPH